MSTAERSKRARCARCDGLLYVDEDGDLGCLLCGGREYAPAVAASRGNAGSAPSRWPRPGAFGELCGPAEAMELLARKRRAA